MMKYIIRFLVLIFIIVSFPIIVEASATTCGELKLVEVMFDPIGSDTGREWIEIQNIGTNPITITGDWRIFDGSNHIINLTNSIDTDTIIPQERALVVSDIAKFQTDYPNMSGKVWRSALSLTNTTETIELRVGNDVCDIVSYTAPDTFQSGYTYEKDGASWKFGATLGGTPFSNVTTVDENQNNTPNEISNPLPTSIESSTTHSLTIQQKKTQWRDANLIYFNELFFDVSSGWIELYNGSTNRIDLTGWVIKSIYGSYIFNTDDFADLILKNNEYIVLPQSISGIRHSVTESWLSLYNPLGELVDQINYGAIQNNKSYSLIDERWRWSEALTPASTNLLTTINTDSGNIVSDIAKLNSLRGLIINEFFPNPQGEDGDEWIELYNSTDHDILIDGVMIDDGEKGSKPFHLDQKVIASKDYLVINKSDSNINLNNANDQVRILYKTALIDSVIYTNTKEGMSYARYGDEWKWTSASTPGDDNQDTVEISGPTNALTEPETLTSAKSSLDGVVTIALGEFWKTKFVIETDQGDIYTIITPRKFTQSIQKGDLVSIAFEGSIDGQEIRATSIIINNHNQALDFQNIRITDLTSIVNGTPVYIEGMIKKVNKKSLIISDEDGNQTKVSSSTIEFDKKDFSIEQTIAVSGVYVIKGNSKYVNIDSKNGIKIIVVTTTDMNSAMIGNLENNSETDIPMTKTKDKENKSIFATLGPLGIIAAVGGYLLKLKIFS